MGTARRVSRRALNDAAGSFDVTVLEATEPSRVVLFSVGGGGDPERHLPLLTSLADQGCTVAAPHFARMVSPVPTQDDLVLRVRRLRLALDHVMRPGMSAAGVGHSIGSTMLLVLAGAEAWTRAAQRVVVAPDPRLDRLALLAPATDFFRAPGALNGVSVPVCAWAGTKDEMTPPAQAAFLKEEIGARLPVEVHLVEGAGHFSFMNAPPPQTVEPLPDRDVFLARLGDQVCRFVTDQDRA
ncbi:MAG: alpha/beta hydrolase [Alphaproteobacteria bacterium]|nr:alpha/beta hydrolase [Alphaproteobacteria bacterium]